MKSKNENNKVSQWLTRSVLFIVAIALLVNFFPRQGDRGYVFQEGRPWSYSLLTAPFDIPIYKDEARLNYERDSIMKGLRPVFTKDNAVASQMIQEFSTQINNMRESAISQQGKQAFIDAIKTIYDQGIISSEQYKSLNDNKVSIIHVRENNTLKNSNTEDFYSPKKAYEEIVAKFPDAYQQHLLQVCNLNNYLVANVLYDSITTNKVRDELLQKIAP